MLPCTTYKIILNMKINLLRFYSLKVTICKSIHRTTLLFSLLISTNTYSQGTLSNGLMAYYPFTGNANDISGNNNNPVFNNATLTSDRFGTSNSAYHFNGVNNYMKVVNNPTINFANQMSIALWVKPTGFYIGPCNNNMLLMKGDADYLQGNYSLRFADGINGCSNSNTSQEYFYDGNGGSSNTPFVQLNQWYSVVSTYDGTTARIYVNCILRASVAASVSTFTNNFDLFFGHLNNAQYPYWLNGDLDEVRIYNRALTQAEVNQYGGCSIPCPSDTSINYNKCFNQNTTLNARAGNTYSWSPATGLSSTTVQFPICSANTNTNYIVTITNTVNSCSYRDTIKVTVNNPAVITTQPTAQTVCSGTTASFTAASSGTGATYQWQSGPTATGPFTNVTTGTGATTGAYTTVATTPAMNGTYYQMLVTTTTCPAIVATTPVLLTVNTVASIVTQPSPQAVCTPQPATFAAAAIGTGLSYQWQVSTSANPTFTNITGATNASYTTPATTFAMNGNQYRVNILSTCSPAVALISNAALLTILNPGITQQPIPQRGCVGDNFTFSVATSSVSSAIVYQWQSSATGAAGTFTNITGANSNTYTITNAPIFLNGYFYRAYISVPCGSGNSTDTSIAVKLLLSNKVSIVLTYPYTSNTNPAVNSGLYTTVSPFGNYVYTWKKNGAIVPNTSTSSFILLAVDDEGSYEVSITDPITGCVSLSNIIKTNAKTSDNLLLDQIFIFPNPASNFIQIRYNNSNSNPRNTMLNIYDGKGARIYTNAYPITGTFGRMIVDVSDWPSETYMVYVMDANGKKLAGGKFVKIK
jgi:Concanavalin A-like lectin/glucanases superfamily/Secretion system C-terminal sorting domain